MRITFFLERQHMDETTVLTLGKQLALGNELVSGSVANSFVGKLKIAFLYFSGRIKLQILLGLGLLSKPAGTETWTAPDQICGWLACISCSCIYVSIVSSGLLLLPIIVVQDLSLDPTCLTYISSKQDLCT